MRLYHIIFLFIFPLALFAQKTKKVEGTYTYYAPENVTLEQAKRVALERAQLETIAETFGTNITQYNATKVANRNGESNVDFMSMSSSDTKGEWIETIDEPIYNVKYEQGMLIVTCKVKGIVREIVSPAIDIKVKVLCNGIEDKFEDDNFKNGDDFYLKFQSPANGYLLVYLHDAESNSVIRILPYIKSNKPHVEIESNKEYLFFKKKNQQDTFVDEYTLTTNKSIELNDLYIVFSVNPIYRATDFKDENKLGIMKLKFEDFEKWLIKSRKDLNTIVTKKTLTINN